MITINLTTRDGQTLPVQGDHSYSFMEAIRFAGVHELDGLCGGQTSCATCHVYIDPAFADHLPPMSDHEDDLLDSSDYRTLTSRLSCQIPCIAELDGVAVTIAPEN